LTPARTRPFVSAIGGRAASVVVIEVEAGLGADGCQITCRRANELSCGSSGRHSY
jgi:hypothetical protein